MSNNTYCICICDFSFNIPMCCKLYHSNVGMRSRPQNYCKSCSVDLIVYISYICMYIINGYNSCIYKYNILCVYIYSINHIRICI